jgi:nitronate monooxygenase
VILDECDAPIVLAPLAGGPSTPALTAAVSEAGGFGILAAGYLSAEEFDERRAMTRRLTTRPFGVNLFVPGPPVPSEAVQRYARTLAADAASVDSVVGEPRHDDDDWDAKIEKLLADPASVVSFTFGRPDDDVIRELHRAGSEVWVTVTGVAEAQAAADGAADLLVAQGAEAGGHRGGSSDDPEDALGLLPLLQLLSRATDLPLVAAGGISTGAAVAAVLACGARAAALGTAFLLCPEAGTSEPHRQALRANGPTAFTRAFSGRTARGIVNPFMLRHSDDAPPGYPDIHHVTSPLRRAARARGRDDLINLWAGQAYPAARELPAGELVAVLMQEFRAATAVFSDGV